MSDILQTSNLPELMQMTNQHINGNLSTQEQPKKEAQNAPYKHFNGNTISAGCGLHDNHHYFQHWVRLYALCFNKKIGND